MSTTDEGGGLDIDLTELCGVIAGRNPLDMLAQSDKSVSSNQLNTQLDEDGWPQIVDLPTTAPTAPLVVVPTTGFKSGRGKKTLPETKEEERVIVPPTQDDLDKLRDLANKTCELYDQIEQLTGSLPGTLAAKKKELKELMQRHGIREISVPNRGPLELDTKKTKISTKKAVGEVVGLEVAESIWAQLPQKEDAYISIKPLNPTE